MPPIQPPTEPDPPPRRWRFSNAELDDGEGRLRIDGREVALQPVPLKLLRVLLDAAPRVVPRDELLARVWHRRPELVSRNVLSNAVARLRSVLGEAGSAHLSAVPGIGYGWRGPVHSLPLLTEAGPPAPKAPDHAEGPQAEADRYMTGLWLDVLRGRSAGHARMTLHEAISAGIGRAETELAGAPLVLACIHRTLAAHRALEHDADGAIHHHRRAWQIAAAPDGQPQPDLAIEARFDLARTLANSVMWCGDSGRLTAARHELAAGRAALRHSPHASTAVRLSGARARFMIAFYEHDWARALAASTEVVRQTEALPQPEPRRLWECRTHHAAILLRAGHEAAAIAQIDGLFEHPPPPLDRGDAVMLQALMIRGGIYACVERYAEAVALLEPLYERMRRDGQLDTSVGPDVAIWLSTSLLHTGRTAEALAMVQAVHTTAVGQLGPGSEAALQPLATLARALATVGRGGEALRLLEEGVGPLLPNLSVPGRRFAVLALARWIDLLHEQGDRRRAAALLRGLRPRDLRAAALRPADAEAFYARCRRAQAPAAQAHPQRSAAAE